MAPTMMLACLVGFVVQPPLEVLHPWFVTRGGPATDESWGVDLAPNGDVLVAAHQSAPLQWPDAHVYRFASDGTEIWHTSFGSNLPELLYIAQLADGILYVGGSQYQGVSPTSADALLAALDPETGELLWTFVWDQGWGYEEIDGMVVEQDAIYLSGWTVSAETSYDTFAMKLGHDRQIQWVETWGSPRWDGANGHLVADERALYVACHWDAVTYAVGGDLALVAFDKEDGSLLWEAIEGAPGLGFEAGLGLAGDEDRLYMVGTRPEPGLGAQLLVWAYDRDGHSLWQTSWGGEGGEVARAIAVDSADGSIVVAGNSSLGGDTDMVFVRLASDGDVLDATRRWGGPAEDVAHDLVLDGSTAFVVGETGSFGAGNLDAFLLRMQHRPWILPR